jgi:hypothetical protein
MILSGHLKDWSIGYNTSVVTATLYLGATSIKDLYKASHKATAYIGPPVSSSNLYGISFDEIKALPVPPLSFTVVSQTTGSGQYYDSDLQPILFSGAILGATAAASPAVLTLDLVYDQAYTFYLMSPYIASNCSYMYSQQVDFKVLDASNNTLADIYNSRLYSATPSTIWSTGWNAGLSQAGTKARVTVTATYNTAYNNTKTTMAGCLPIHTTLSSLNSIPTYGVILDPITGSCLFLSNLSIDYTAIQTVDVG